MWSYWFMFLMCWILPLSDTIRCFDKKEGIGGNLELKKNVFASEWENVSWLFFWIGRCKKAPSRYEWFQPFFREGNCCISNCNYCTNAYYKLVGDFALEIGVNLLFPLLIIWQLTAGVIWIYLQAGDILFSLYLVCSEMMAWKLQITYIDV